MGCAAIEKVGQDEGIYLVCSYDKSVQKNDVLDNFIEEDECKKRVDNGEADGSYVDLTNSNWSSQCLDAHNKLRSRHGVPPLKLDDDVRN